MPNGSNIKLNYEQLRAVAAEVRQRAAESQSAMTIVQREVTALRALWAGAARGAFDQAFAQFEKEVRHVPNLLIQVAQALTETAQIVQQAELQAKNGIVHSIVDDTSA